MWTSNPLWVYVRELFHIHGNSGSEFGAEWSSGLEVGWNLEQQKYEMGYPLTKTPIPLSIEFTALANEDEETKDKKFFLL